MCNKDRGYALGSLCVIDNKEHTLTPFQQEALKRLAKQVISLMQLKKKNKALTNLVNALEQRTAELEEEIRILKEGRK